MSDCFDRIDFKKFVSILISFGVRKSDASIKDLISGGIKSWDSPIITETVQSKARAIFIRTSIEGFEELVSIFDI